MSVPRCLLLLAVASPCLAKEPIVFDFEDPESPLNEVWVPSPLDGGPQNVRISEENPRTGKRSLKLYGRLPEGFGVTYTPWQEWQGYSTLSFDLWVSPNAQKIAKDFDCWLYLKDRSYYWFQTSIYKDPVTLKRKVAVKPGQWAHFEVDISEQSKAWVPGGHKRTWDYATHRPREFGFRFFGKRPWEGSVFIDNITLSGDDPHPGKRPPTLPAVEPGKRVIKPAASARSVPVYEKLELTFFTATRYENPFDPEVVDVQGHFRAPSGQEVSVPGFYYQDYERSETAEGFEQMIPVGGPCWKIRFAPREQGEYTYWVTLTDANGEASSEPARFTATAPEKPQGFIRVSHKDPHYFEFENGDWYYPIGINMRDGGDDASKQKGTLDFDYYFRRFHEEGLNFVRTWMCAWWAGIEWSDEYHSRFDDIGRYNMYNAWRLDHCVDLAKANDLYLEVTFNSHGQLRRDKFDEEWTYSPWNVRNGGYLASPAMFFTSERAKKDYKNRYRYIIARWGYSRNIMSWDLWNEIDLAEGYYGHEAAKWHAEMAQYLKQIDPNKHIVGTHICLFWTDLGTALWQTPEIEMVKSDAYWDQKEDRRLDMGMFVSYLGKTIPSAGYKPLYDKPFVFIEYGPLYASVAGGADPAVWRAKFRIGLWTSAVLPTATPAHYWYHKEWDQHRLYRYQKAVQKLFAGYDRRGREFRLRCSAPQTGSIMILGVDNLRAIGMVNNQEGFLYVNDPEKMGVEDRAQIQATQGAKLALLYMSQGDWDVEFVDTLTGEVTSKAQGKVDREGGMLRFDLPPVADDLLVHVLRKA